MRAAQETAHFNQSDETAAVVDETAAAVKRCYCRITTLLWVALATVALIIGGAGGGLYVYKLGPGFLGLVPKEYGVEPYNQLKNQLRDERLKNKALTDGARLADAIINDTYTDHLRRNPFSTLTKHEQRHIFEIAFEAGLVDILNWISDSPEALNPSRLAILKKRIDDLNRGEDLPFARHDGMYFRQKYYDLKNHHEMDHERDHTIETALKTDNNDSLGN